MLSSLGFAHDEQPIVTEDAIIMPITNRSSNFVFSPKVKNVKVTPLGFVLYQDITIAP